jgi:hypothetical protein
MDEKKYQIFVSSTYKDLIGAREKIIETILRLYHFPVGMEMFSADDDEQWEVIKDTIDISDYYVLIIGHRYGSITAEGLSYTEKEYDYAKSQNIPILAFIRNRDVATKPQERDENSDSIEKLNQFIEKATKSKMCDFWENEDDLSTKIAIALPKIFRKNSRIGWIRANKAISPEVSEERAKLSSENRNIRIEKDQLKALIEDKKPNISIKFNGKKELELVFIKKEDLKIEFHNNQLPFSTIEYPQKITFESVPEHLKSYLVPLSSPELENYNQSLPSNDEVDEYNWHREIFFRIKGTSIDLNIDIYNLGISKANEIFVDIEFPKEILVMDKYDIKDFKHPGSPIPEDPLRKAEKKYKEDQKRKKLPFSGYDFARDFMMPSYDSPLHSLQDTIANINTNKEIHTELNEDENKITIRIKSLLHTRKVSIDDFAAIPIKAGQFDIKLSVVCEEYSEAQKIVMPIKVKDDYTAKSLS